MYIWMVDMQSLFNMDENVNVENYVKNFDHLT